MPTWMVVVGACQPQASPRQGLLRRAQ